MNAVEIDLNFQVNVMGKAVKKYAQSLWYLLLAEGSGNMHRGD